MKCPKCGYLGFETVNRCRNCGYDFSMSADRGEPELTLRDSKDAAASLADYELASGQTAAGGRAVMDLDRLIGVPDEPEIERNHERDNDLDSEPDIARGFARDLARETARDTAPEIAAPIAGRFETVDEPEPAEELPRIIRSGSPTPLLDAAENAVARAAEARTANLPLFSTARASEDDERELQEEPSLVAPPRPAGPPLAVRRATQEAARPRTRGPRTARRDDPGLAFSGDSSFSTLDSQADGAAALDETSPFAAAPRVRRIAAAAIDTALLTGICAAVLYLTLRFTERTFDDIRLLPMVPMAAFLILIVAGYLMAFTAAGGQTIGKMATHIRVIGDDGRAVDISGAALRTAGNAIQIVTLGLAWLPALLAADGRGIADRIAGTRVVRA